MNYTKRLFAMILGVVIMASVCLPFTGIVANAQGDGIDVILAVDDTRSMEKTDPSKLSAEAIRKFVDKFAGGQDLRLGITTYAVDVMPGSLPLGATAEEIKNFSNNNITQAGKGTDAAVGLNWAVNQLKKDDGRKKAIILIGDGDNTYTVGGAEVRTDAESNAMLADAIKNATDKGVAVHTLAINPQDEEFKKYFEDIATNTYGTSHLPTQASDLDGIMDKIFEAITGQKIQDQGPTTLPKDQPVTKEITVPDGVFEMNLQCDHQKPISIDFQAPDGTIYNEGSAGVTFSQEQTYSNYKIQEPAAGVWKVTYLSDIDQTITPKFIFHADLTIELAKNQQDVIQNEPVEYIVTVSSRGSELTDDASLEGFKVKLFVTPIDDNGTPGKTKEEDMKVKDGKFSIEYAVSDAGKYQVYAELSGKNSIKSNTLEFEAMSDGSLPGWVTALIIGGILLIIVLVIVIIMKSRGKDGSGYVKGSVTVKIVGRMQDGDTMIFQQERFNCEQIFGKKNTLSDLITAYKNRYSVNNFGEMAERTLYQYMSPALYEVTNKIQISGNKNKQTIIRIPVGNEMIVDGMDVTKPKAIIFNAPEKAIELKFNNQGCNYTIYMVFTKM